ncbi:MAG: hypothetical protein NTY46_09805, partial [Candidatus Sumerlaeota bacterium]|nr:hypothetical protein [Candidatus Sumerlaeota bacterium]
TDTDARMSARSAHFPNAFYSRIPSGLLATVFLFCVFMLTASRLRFGYEGFNMDQCEALLRGTLARLPDGRLAPYTQGGILEVAACAPFAALKAWIGAGGGHGGLQQLAHAPALPLYTAILCLLFFGLAREIYGNDATAVMLTLILGICTMVWPYSKFGMETFQTMGTVGGAWALLRHARTRSTPSALAFGCALGALALTKVSGAVHAALLGMAGLWLAWRMCWWKSRGFWRNAALAVLPCAAAAAIFLLTNRWRYGGWVTAGRYSSQHIQGPAAAFGAFTALIFSPGKSLFVFSPPLLIGLCYWGWFWRAFPMARPVMIAALLAVVFHLHLDPWTDETWGPRRFHFVIPFLLLPAGLWLEGWRGLGCLPRWSGLAALSAGFIMQLIAVLFDFTALPFVLGKNFIYTSENFTWNPALMAPRFNLFMLESMIARLAAGQPLRFVYNETYMPWLSPAKTPYPISFDLSGQDRPDFWYLQHLSDYPNFNALLFTSACFILFVIMATACGAVLYMRLRRGRITLSHER